MKEQGIIQFLRFLISAIIGFWLVHRLNMEGFIVVVFFFGIYIAVSIFIEIIRKYIFSKQSKNKD
ncbi:MAG: hypothetical protein L3J74_08230 [Bacteroidales bacterium]|nr:hypothetical protein [Bacteroidales bacterium]